MQGKLFSYAAHFIDTRAHIHTWKSMGLTSLGKPVVHAIFALLLIFTVTKQF